MYTWLTCCTTGYRKIGPPSVNRSRTSRSATSQNLPEASSYSPSESVTPTGFIFQDQVKLMSFNIFVRPDIPIGLSSEYQDVRIELFSTHVLPHYHIVCLQEMFSVPLSSRRHSLIEQAKRLGFHWHHIGKRNYSLSPTIDGGLLVLSKLPIVKSDTLNFSSAAFADWYAEKGVLYCLVQTGPQEGHFVHLFCTHLQATYDEKGQSVSRNVRKEQIAQTVDFINKCVKNRDDWPILICGDFNVQSRKGPQDGTDSDEYIDVVSLIRSGLGVRGELLRDLTREIDGQTHPVTYGDSFIDPDGSIHPKEVSLTDVGGLKKHASQCNQALDKIFWIPSPERRGLMEPEITIINPMIIDKTSWNIVPNHPLTHLSDHYAVETTLRVQLPPNA